MTTVVTDSIAPAASRLAMKTSWSCDACSSKPSNSWGPRSLPAWGSIAMTSTPSAAARPKTIADRPW